VTPEVEPRVDAPMLRADDGEFSHTPAFLQVRPSDSDEATRRPRRRRAPAAFTSDDAAPVVEEG